MRKANDKKKQQLKNVGTATALTITLATSNVPTLAYAMELEKDINEEVVVEEVLTETAANEEVVEEIVNDEDAVQEEIVANEEVTEEVTEEVAEDVVTQEVDSQTTVSDFDLSEWECNQYSAAIILNKYTGIDTDIVIPGEFQGKQIKIGTMGNTAANDCFSGKRSTITSLTFEEVNGKKVQLPDSVTKDAFAGFTAMINIDLSGADISKLSEISSLFSGCTSLESANLSGVSLPNIKSISNVFSGCTALKHIDLSNVTTSSNLTSASKMFEGLSSLESVNLSGLNISNVSNIYNMFNDCTSLKSVDLSGFDTSKVTNMTSLFLGCSSLTDVTFGGQFTTKLVKNMNNMFKDCTSLRSVDLSKLDTTSATNMSYMFSDSGLESLDLSGFNTSQVETMKGMFRNTEHLEEIVFGDEFKTPLVTDMSFMFCNSGIYNLDLSNFQTLQVTDMTAMFGSLDNINILDLSNFVLNNGVNMHRMFAKNISVASANNNIVEHEPTNFKKELLVIATDQKLKEYNYYIEDACLPVGLTLNANGGKFEDGNEIIELKTNVIDKLDETTIDEEIKNILDKAIPTRDEHRFISWEAKKITRANSSVFDKINTVYYAKWEATPGDDFDNGMNVNPDEIPSKPGIPDNDLDSDMEVMPEDEQTILPDDTLENPDVDVKPPMDDEKQEDNNGNSSTSNPGTNDNPQTGDTGVLGSIGLGLTSILGIFINNRKKKK